MNLTYSHVDVFSRVPYGGNSLPVFPDAADLSAEQMLRITQEMRHFEAVFLLPTNEPGTVAARIFDLFEELPFAGHPIIGAAAVLHQRRGLGGAQRSRPQVIRAGWIRAAQNSWEPSTKVIKSPVPSTSRRTISIRICRWKS